MQPIVEAVKDWWEFAAYVVVALFTGAVGATVAHQKVNALQQRVTYLEENVMVEGECVNFHASCQKFNAQEFTHIAERHEELKLRIEEYHKESQANHECLVKVLLEWRKESKES